VNQIEEEVVMTVAMALTLALTGICFWISVGGIGLNLIGRLFYSRLKPKRGIMYWLFFFIMPLAMFLFFARASKLGLGDGVWW
jgi:hypothetical protein